MNVAAALTPKSGAVDDVRLVAGGVQCVPRRLLDSEELVRGSDAGAEVAAAAGAAAIEGARPLNYNHFKIPLLEKLVARAVTEAKA